MKKPEKEKPTELKNFPIGQKQDEPKINSNVKIKLSKSNFEGNSDVMIVKVPFVNIIKW